MMKPPNSATTSCGQSIELLDSYVSGELDRSAAVAVDDHLIECATCAQFVEDRRCVRTALRSAVDADADAPRELLGDVLATLREGGTQQQRRASWQPLAMAAGLVLAAAGALAVGWMSFGNGPFTVGADRAAVRLASDAEHHSKCVQEMAGRVAPAVSGERRPDAGVANVEAMVREQAIGGMTIADAHRCTDGERRYIHVVIDREGAVGGVLVSDRVEAGDGLPVVATAREATFAVGGHVVSVLSDSSAIDAGELAERLRPSMSERLVGFLTALRVVRTG